MKKILITIMLILNLNAHSLDTAEIILKLRGVSLQYIGEDLTNKIFGEEEKKYNLPKLPRIVKNTISMDVYEKKVPKKDVSYTPEQLNEYDLSFIEELVFATREVKANLDDVGKWYNVLSQGASREGVYRALVLDDYYRRLENYNELSSGAVQSYAMTFLAEFVGQEVNEKSLREFNLYTVKRIVTEKALDISDSFIYEGRVDDFYLWYALLSVDLPSRFPIFENKLRASKSVEHHLAWAKKMPIQFIKSEIILKIHLVFNNLQKR